MCGVCVRSWRWGLRPTLSRSRLDREHWGQTVVCGAQERRWGSTRTSWGWRPGYVLGGGAGLTRAERARVHRGGPEGGIPPEAWWKHHGTPGSARLEDAALRDRLQAREACPQPHASSARGPRVLSLSGPAGSVGSALVPSPPSGWTSVRELIFRLACSGSARIQSASIGDAAIRPGAHVC